MNGLRSQNGFSRIQNNIAKMGAYYTDVAHCKDIKNFLSFPESKDVCVLEPSIGDASAVIAATGADTNTNIKIFGVELNTDSANFAKESPFTEEVLEADFLEGVRIKNNAFSMVFGNPPYMDDDLAEGEKTVRVEKQFLEKVTNYLVKGGLLVWVIPYTSLVETSSMRFILGHYEILSVYKFRPEEYAKYKQIVLFARKTDSHFPLLQTIQDAQVRYNIDSLDELPSVADKTFEVPSVESDKITLFTTKAFNVEEAFNRLFHMEEDDKLQDLFTFVDKKLSYPEYRVNDLGKPPIPLKKDSMYLLATSGSGQGLTGSEETHDLHLQRGVAEVIEDAEVDVDEEDPKRQATVKVTTRTKVTMTVVEQSGKITVLE